MVEITSGLRWRAARIFVVPVSLEGSRATSGEVDDLASYHCNEGGSGLEIGSRLVCFTITTFFRKQFSEC